MRTNETEVLVVGAGPVGMMTALLLAEAGIRVEIIDQAWRTAAHSYACVLHPTAMKLLDRVNLLDELLQHSRPIKTIGFYDGEFRRTELKFSAALCDFPYAVTVSQSHLESLLEDRLRMADVPVHWNYRLADLKFEEDSVTATVEKLSRTAKGYIVPDWDWTVEKTSQTRAAFVIGADGIRSLVRNRTGIKYEPVSEFAIFNVFEFETATEPASEARIVLDDRSTNVLWPLPGNRCRWSFQSVARDSESDPHEKERQSIWLVQEEIDRQTVARVNQFASERAPWFRDHIKDVDWSVRIRFEGRLAKSFGSGRCWLVGDAAHQTGPVGGQSMNAGFCEAQDLVDKLELTLRAGSGPEILENYGAFHRARWRTLLGLSGDWVAADAAIPWVKERCARIVPCIPATGGDLDEFANQAGIAFHKHHPGSPATSPDTKRELRLAQQNGAEVPE